MGEGWSLFAGELRIPYGTALAAHRMILVVNPGGRIVRQLNGLASWLDRTSGTWRHKPIGYLPSDRLRGYDTAQNPRTWMPVHGVDSRTWNAAGAIERGDLQVLAGGLAETQLRDRLAPLLEALARINALSPGPEGGAGLPYPFLGFGRNSNSVYRTLLGVLGASEPRFATQVWLAPGRRSLLLPPTVLERVRQKCPS
jgi:hypothetical protein